MLSNYVTAETDVDHQDSYVPNAFNYYLTLSISISISRLCDTLFSKIRLC